MHGCPMVNMGAQELNLTIKHYSLPSINVNPREWIEVNIYRGVNSYQL